MGEVCAGKPQEPWLLPAAWAATMACLDALSRPADRHLLLKRLAGSALPFSSSSFDVTIRSQTARLVASLRQGSAMSSRASELQQPPWLT